MRHLCTIIWLGTALLLADVVCGQSAPESAEPARRELSAARRVGVLRQVEQRFELTDNWDKKTYTIQAAPGLELVPFVGRYVTLRGETLVSIESGSRSFVAERITALDGQKPESARAARVQLAAVEFEEPELPSDSAARREAASGATPRVAALTDGLPRPSEVVEELQAPPVINIPTGPEVIAGPQPFDGPPPAAGADWLGFLNPSAPGPGERWFGRGEYLLWVTDSLRTPPLVTTSPAGTPRTSAGVLGEPGTSVLYGVGSINNDPHSGVRLRVGRWLGASRNVGAEAEYLWFDDQQATFQASSNGSQILARPFFDVLNGRETAELVSFPGVVRGEVAVDALTEFQSGGLRLRLNECGEDSCDCGAPIKRRLDWLMGYRYLQLEDDLTIREDLVSLDPRFPGTFEISDSFSTDNVFHGIDFGIVHEADLGPLFIEVLSKVALGINQQAVTIQGVSDIDEAGLLERFQGGILAQRSNIGRYTRDEFAVVPELGVTLGWQVTRNWSLTAGYSLIYFSSVVRAGDQIDLEVNPNLFPPEADPFSGALRPAFAFRETDFWAHGLSFGGDFRW